MGSPLQRSVYSISDYLRRERESLDRHEYRDGDILPMPSGSADHSLIVANVIGEVGNHLKGKPCRVYDSNLRVRIPRTVLYTYPDASIICGPRETDPNDPTGETVTNPKVVIEVLSPNTEAYDRGEKFSRYRQLDSLQEYILISQDTPGIESFLRQPEGTWILTPTSGLETSARLQSLGIELSLAEVYAGIEFGPKEPDPQQKPETAPTP